MRYDGFGKVPVILLFVHLVLFVSFAFAVPEVVDGSYIIQPNYSALKEKGLNAKSIEASIESAAEVKIKRDLGHGWMVIKDNEAGLGVSANNRRIVGYGEKQKKFCKHLYEKGIVETCQPNFVKRIYTTPNDPQYSSLNGLIDIDAASAWSVVTGSNSVVVAVIDTGVMYDHGDLEDNIWVNPNEIEDNEIDDDGNGWIDDIHGANFISDSDYPGDPYDDEGHGTHVSGTIGAVGNNSLGVVGVNWNVKIMALKFLDSDGSGTTSDAIRAIDYMVTMKNAGVNIVASNNSWGGDGTDSALSAAIARARAAGILFVAAAGNDGINIGSSSSSVSPGGDVNAVTVAAIDPADRSLAYFSNYSSNLVNLAAPGVGILSTNNDGDYEVLSGTSMATPHVTGAIALVAGAYPDLSPSQLVSLMYDSVDTLSGFGSYVKTAGTLNLAAYLSLAGGTTPIPDAATVSAVDIFRSGSNGVAASSTTPVRSKFATFKFTGGGSGNFSARFYIGTKLCATKTYVLTSGLAKIRAKVPDYKRSFFLKGAAGSISRLSRAVKGKAGARATSNITTACKSLKSSLRQVS